MLAHQLFPPSCIHVKTMISTAAIKMGTQIAM